MREAHTPAPIGTARYRIIAPIGSGGMGTVYRAMDRLNSQTVALKRVEITPDRIDESTGAPDEHSQQDLLALAHEFRTLAALRHPHIISVLDYGFDERREPFFTMELLPDAQTLLEAGGDMALAGRVGLLIQALEALAYLHRRSLLHHDLKPGNILVADGRLRLLDFGLAVIADQRRDSDMFGTLIYLAPEVLGGQPYTAAADLYSLGVLAYELLVGQHPFPATTAHEFLQRVQQAPDLGPLRQHPPLAGVIGRLLAKTPSERPGSAQATIALLREAVGLAQPPDPAIRESYLQAAAFVGREAEAARLRAALARTLAGASEVWLIGGESGVGKSRLLDEIRIEALVAGALVAGGQAAEGSGQPYQIWREPLRRLALEVGLDDLQASVLKALVPDLADLIGRPVADAPGLPGEAGRLRLHTTVVELLQRVGRPLLILLEDLQWSRESLALLQDAARQLRGSPILFIGSYRADEWRADGALADAQHIRLERLAPATIAELSVAMLGPAGGGPAVLDLLQRESEGNTFFLIEAARALAEIAGGLDRIGESSAPRSIFAGGMRRVLLRRLAQVPAWGQPLLRLAAVVGRRIEPAVLAHLAEPGLDLDAWLRAGADAAVLELADQHWRFAHDKLRDALLADLSAADLPDLHRRSAEAIEAAHPAEQQRRAYAEALLDHWHRAGRPERAVGYALSLAGWMCDYSAEYDRAAGLLGLADDLAAQMTEPDRAPAQLQILLLRGRVGLLRGRRPDAREPYAQALELARRLGDRRSEALASAALAEITAWMGDPAESERILRANLDLIDQLDDPRLRADGLRLLAVVRHWQGHPAEARGLFEAALAGAGDDQRLRAVIIGDMSQQVGDQGDIHGATAGFEEVLAISRAIGDRAGEAFAMMNIAFGLVLLGDLDHARATYTACLALTERHGLASTMAYALRGLGSIADKAGDLAGAIAYYHQSMAAAQGSLTHQLECLNAITIAQARMGDPAARATLADLLGRLGEIQIPEFQIEGVAAAAAVLWSAGQARAAAELVALVDATPVISADARESITWLRGPLAQALADDERSRAAQRGAERDMLATLDEMRRWVASAV